MNEDTSFFSLISTVYRSSTIYSLVEMLVLRVSIMHITLTLSDGPKNWRPTVIQVS